MCIHIHRIIFDGVVNHIGKCIYLFCCKIAGATERAEKLAALEVTIAAKAGDEGRLFGSVTTADIVAALAAQSGVILDRKKVVAQPIRTTGSHTAIVRLHADVECTVKLSVVAG